MDRLLQGIRAAVFDMDGTLLDTMPYWRYTTLEYLLYHQLPVPPEDLARMYASSSRRLLPEILRRIGAPVPPFDEMVAEMEGYMHRHYLYDAHLKDPVVPAFLEALRARGVRMCVATGSPSAFASDGLRRLGLLEYFEFVVDNHDPLYDKQKPESFVRLARRLGATAEECLVAEDALYSIRSAKAAGCRVLAIEDDTALAQRDEIRALADRMIKSYAELNAQ